MIFYAAVFAGVVAVALIALLINLRRYERENVAAARAELVELREEMGALRTRLEVLEALAAEEPLSLPPETESLAPPGRSERTRSRS
ncbi:MAG: hypothetical protein AAGI71_01705 [Bacteroidota bacterium]